MPRSSTLRASDQDRDQAADRLRRATGEGRLLAEELEERLEKVFSARTYGQLSALTADLPTHREGKHHPSLPLSMRAGLAIVLALGVLLAVAVATALLVTIICLWAAWMIISWTMFGKRPRAPRLERSRELARAARHTRAIFVPRGGRGTF